MPASPDEGDSDAAVAARETRFTVEFSRRNDGRWTVSVYHPWRLHGAALSLASAGTATSSTLLASVGHMLRFMRRTTAQVME